MKSLRGFALSWRKAPHRFGGLGALVGVVPAVDSRVAKAAIDVGPLTGSVRTADLRTYVDGVVAGWATRALSPSPGGHLGFGMVGNVPDDGTMTLLQSRPIPDALRPVALPPVAFAAVGRRSHLMGEVSRVAPSLHHEFQVDGLGLTEEEASRAVPFLRGFFVLPISWKESDKDAPNTVGSWQRQGTHLRRLVVEPRIVSGVGGTVKLALTAGLEGGLALAGDDGQIWTGFDGYVMVVHTGLLVPPAPAPASEVAVQLGSLGGGASFGSAVFPKGAGQLFVLRGFDLTIAPEDDEPGLRGRLVREMGVTWRPSVASATARYSNHGVDPRGYFAAARFPYSAVSVMAANADQDGDELPEIPIG